MIAPAPRLQSPAPHLNVRWMLRRDMEQVLRIEREAFEFPWNESDFVRVLRQRNCIGMVAANRSEDREDCGKEVFGFMVYELLARRIVVLNLAVDPCHCRGGIGRAMIEKLQAKLSPRRRASIVVEIRERNLPAQLFFRALGFRVTKITRGRFRDTPEDCYVFVYKMRD